MEEQKAAEQELGQADVGGLRLESMDCTKSLFQAEATLYGTVLTEKRGRREWILSHEGRNCPKMAHFYPVPTKAEWGMGRRKMKMVEEAKPVSVVQSQGQLLGRWPGKAGEERGR